MLTTDGNRLVYQYYSESDNALRVRATHEPSMPSENRALQEEQVCSTTITIGEKEASILNGRIKAVITSGGKLAVFNSKG